MVELLLSIIVTFTIVSDFSSNPENNMIREIAQQIITLQSGQSSMFFAAIVIMFYFKKYKKLDRKEFNLTIEHLPFNLLFLVLALLSVFWVYLLSTNIHYNSREDFDSMPRFFMILAIVVNFQSFFSTFFTSFLITKGITQELKK